MGSNFIKFFISLHQDMKSTKIFYDTKSTGLHQDTTLISIGLVSECGKHFYMELSDYDFEQLDDWVMENVVENLVMQEAFVAEDEFYSVTRHSDNPVGNNIYKSYSIQLRGDTSLLKFELEKWLDQFKHVEMWSDCLAYNWVLFCEIWGGALDIPGHILYTPFDLSTMFKINGINPDADREEFAEVNIPHPANTSFSPKHNALWDAEVIMKCFQKMIRSNN